MKNRISEFVVGLIFGLGLIVSGMTDPGKVLGFLDLAGLWDPSLAFVMGGAIAVGVFAFAVIVSSHGGFSAYAGGVALAVLMLPTILLTSEQALLGVQSAYREASFGLGATKFQTILRIVLPDALPAIMTGPPILFILPELFIVILGPAACSIADAFVK